ncbi:MULTISPECIES: aminotransferase-like domain-containing protein [unclassified Streptomyces]|uniref:aminotransferase-like domain-containing protein n=1 Tax=unclassified Streptomyces TaxID=2593676 RepID=UPI002E16332E|nr:MULTISPECIES: PLP-dependent aminotransferase family protein [unclassified Streptomyces]WSR22597.1 PLP-dependent aminotransferase family protein [Streptomyces sp. NBC_01205]
MDSAEVHRSKGSKARAGGSDFLQLDPAQAPPGRRTEWLTDRIRAAIADGTLPVGSRLPAGRVLAAELGVSRGLVTEAYQRLADAGQVVGRGRAGTTVVAAPIPPVPLAPARSAPPSAPPEPGAPIPSGGPFAAAGPAGPVRPAGPPGPAGPADQGDQGDQGRQGGQGEPLAILDRVRSAEPGCPAGSGGPEEPARQSAPLAPADPVRSGGVAGLGSVVDELRAVPARIDLSPGVPDLTAFPRTAWLQAERRVLADLTPGDFGYGNPQGAPALRTAVTGWLARNRGIRADPDEVVIVAGVAQALGLLSHVLREGGVGRVAVEDPGSLGARQQLEYGRLETVAVPVDGGGLDVAALRASGARAVLLTPAHQFPTGVVLDGERRRDLLAWAAAGGLVVEDDYDAEHRYDRAPVPALRALLPDGVCYAGSVSKLLAPALRLGWLLVPPRLRDAVVAAKRYADLGNPLLAQLVLARLMDSGELERHLRFVRRRHRRRRDAVLRAIAAHLPGARVHGAAAGLHLMVTFDGAAFEDTALAAAGLSLGVKAHPLSWHRMRPGPPGLVLGYAAGPPGELEEGVALLGRALSRLTRAA